MSTCHRVFVYGTLKKGNPVRGLDSASGPTFVGPAVTVDNHFKMIDFGDFPAVLISSSGQQRISGEIFLIPSELMPVLDAIEGYPNFYDRMIVDTTLGKAWIYYLPDINYFSDFLEKSVNLSVNQNIASWNRVYPKELLSK